MLLIRNSDSILTLDRDRRILARHSVLIKDSRITQISETATLDHNHLAGARQEGKVIEVAGGVTG